MQAFCHFFSQNTPKNHFFCFARALSRALCPLMAHTAPAQGSFFHAYVTFLLPRRSAIETGELFAGYNPEEWTEKNVGNFILDILTGFTEPVARPFEDCPMT